MLNDILEFRKKGDRSGYWIEHSELDDSERAMREAEEARRRMVGIGIVAPSPPPYYIPPSWTTSTAAATWHQDNQIPNMGG